MLAERIEQALGGALRATVPPPGFAAGVVGLLGAGSGAVATGSGASAKVGAGASSGVWAMASGALLGFWLLYSASKQSALSDKDRRSMERGFWFQVLIFSLFGPGLFYVMIKGGSASHLGAFLLGFGFTAFTQCVIIWSLRCRERSLLAEGVDAASAAKVWRFDYGQKGFWPAMAGYLLILGSGTNYAFTFVTQELRIFERYVVFMPGPGGRWLHPDLAEEFPADPDGVSFRHQPSVSRLRGRPLVPVECGRHHGPAYRPDFNSQLPRWDSSRRRAHLLSLVAARGLGPSRGFS
jgi:hypothetical protein